MRTWLITFGITLTLTACARDKPSAAAADSPTRRQIDSAIGVSGLPGAQGVTKAMGVADSAAASAARLDSANKSP